MWVTWDYKWYSLIAPNMGAFDYKQYSLNTPNTGNLDYKWAQSSANPGTGA